ncbi:MAG: PAS domain-containing protein [Sphaerochaeta sp.]|uniref:PAS domain-containing protein n=1 Tax=Sphaerochaeta sp. TaxID=1972642 RepID=UPI003D13B397
MIALLSSSISISMIVLLFLGIGIVAWWACRAVLCSKKPVALPNGESILECMPDGCLVLDAQGCITEVNAAYLRLTGFQRSDLVGTKLAKVSANTACLPELTGTETGTPALHMTRHRCKDGSTVDLEVSVNTVVLPNRVYHCVYRDRAKRMEATLDSLQGNELLRYVIEHSRSAIAIHDVNLHYLYVSQAYLQQYHLPSMQQVIGKHHYEVISDLPQKWRLVHQRALLGEMLQGEDDPYTRPDGTVEYTRWECRPWYTEGGAIGGIIVYTEMTTKQKQIERELRQANEYLEALISQSHSPILVWDVDAVITRTNSALACLLKTTVEQLVGSSMAQVFSFLPPSVSRALFSELKEKGHLETAEISIPQSDGRRVTLLWEASPIIDPVSKTMVATIARGQDISERIRIEAQNKTQLEELKRWYAVMNDREHRILELKTEVNQLLMEEGKAIRYPSVKENR